MSKVEGGGGPIDPPSRLRVSIFSRRLLGLIIISHFLNMCKSQNSNILQLYYFSIFCLNLS